MRPTQCYIINRCCLPQHQRVIQLPYLLKLRSHDRVSHPYIRTSTTQAGGLLLLSEGWENWGACLFGLSGLLSIYTLPTRKSRVDFVGFHFHCFIHPTLISSAHYKKGGSLGLILYLMSWNSQLMLDRAGNISGGIPGVIQEETSIGPN